MKIGEAIPPKIQLFLKNLTISTVFSSIPNKLLYQSKANSFPRPLLQTASLYRLRLRKYDGFCAIAISEAIALFESHGNGFEKPLLSCKAIINHGALVSHGQGAMGKP